MNILLMLGTQRLIQELLEQDAADYRGRERYERNEEIKLSMSMTVMPHEPSQTFYRQKWT